MMTPGAVSGGKVGAMAVREVQHDDGGHLVLVDGWPQSHVDLADPTHLVFDYVRRLADVIDGLPPGPLRAVHVGGAGLTLPRYLAATRPRSSQVVLEPDEKLTALVRERLPLPSRSGIKVRPVDGRSGLAHLPDDRADLLVLDAYVNGRVPDDLLTGQAMAEVARVLSGSGLALLNVVDQAPFPVIRSTIAGLVDVLPYVAAGLEPATRRARRPGNVLLVAGREEPDVAGWRARASTHAAPYQVLAGREVSASFGGGTPTQDPETAC